MDLKTIETFLCAADLGSFTKTAAKLGYVQSTVTMQIKQLEQELGFPLFDRIGRKVSLTPAGMSFVPYANEMVHILQQVHSMGKRAEALHGTLKIGILESLLFTAMMDIVPIYQKRFPHVTIEFVMGPASDLIRLLQQNQLDMIYISNQLEVPADLSLEYKRQESMIFIAGAHHELAHAEPVPLKDLLGYSLIMAERSGICYRRLVELAGRERLEVNSSILVNSINGIVNLLKSSNGVSFLPEYAVAGHIASGELCEVKVAIGEQRYYSQVLCHRSKWISPFVQYMISLIREKRPESD